jgi:hypothetical protein
MILSQPEPRNPRGSGPDWLHYMSWSSTDVYPPQGGAAERVPQDHQTKCNHVLSGRATLAPIGHALRMESDDEQRVMSTGLVEYFVLAVPDESGVAVICKALQQLIAQGTIRVLDLVVVEHADDRLVVHEPDSPAAPERPSDVVGTTPGVLSQHDIALAASALPPHFIGVIVVTDDRWAEPLALAVQRAGGHIVGGDRVSARRLAALPVDGPSLEGGN